MSVACSTSCAVILQPASNRRLFTPQLLECDPNEMQKRKSIFNVNTSLTKLPRPHFLAISSPWTCFWAWVIFRIQKFSLSLWAADVKTLLAQPWGATWGETTRAEGVGRSSCVISHRWSSPFPRPSISSALRGTPSHIHEKHLFDSQMYSPLSIVNCDENAWDGINLHVSHQWRCHRSSSPSAPPPPSSHEGPTRPRGEQMRPTFVWQTQDGSAVARLDSVAPLYAPFPFLKSGVGG